MGFERWGFYFDGCHESPEKLQPDPGVYVIWCKTGNDWKVLDAGQAQDVKDRVTNHDRAHCWSQNCEGKVLYSATYTRGMDGYERSQIETQIRTLTDPPCGEY